MPRPPTGRRALLGLTASVLAYAVAMAYLESASVVYLRHALDAATGDVFPLDMTSRNAGLLGWLELGREIATLVMIAAVGWIAGRGGLERLAWAAVVFGAWDIAYYFWLWVFSGWPGGLTTWDLLFLIPLPWAGPVWAPLAVSLALIGFGLALIGRIRRGARPRMSRAQLGTLLLGGVVVIGSFLLNAEVVLAGRVPTDFMWPMFGIGMAIGIVAAVGVLRSSSEVA